MSDAASSRIARIAWITGVAFALILFVIDLGAYQQSRGISINGSAIWGRDFANVWTSGRLVIEGNLDILYDPQAYQQWQSARFGWGISAHNYSYPPLTLLYTPLFGALPYFAALGLWTLLSLVAFFWAARPWLKDAGLPALAAIGLPSSLVCVWACHYGLFLGALWLTAWRTLDRKPVLAGILTGLMAVKPHLAVLMPLMFLLRGQWKAMFAAGLTVLLLVGASTILFGWELWQTYFTRTSGDQISLLNATQTYFIKMMPTLSPALYVYGFNSQTVWTLQALLAAGAIAALWRWLPRDNAQASMAAAVATFLVLPYGFNYDMTVIGLAAAQALHRAAAQRRAGHAALAGFVLVLPAILFHLNRLDIWIAPLALALFLASLLLQARQSETV